jgi:1,4-dihydroxy-2-naphthoyl-CoA synthase
MGRLSAKMWTEKSSELSLGRSYLTRMQWIWGLNAVIPHAELEDTAYEWAQEILGKSPTIKMLICYEPDR